MDILKR